jgi:hypothetical protein
MKAILVSDIVQENGKTVKQNNLEKTHSIAIGSLVEIQNDSDYGEENTNGLRLFVVDHARDCDGTPLYSLSFKRDALNELKEAEAEQKQIKNNRQADATEINLVSYCYGLARGAILHGYPEECLLVILAE